MIETTKRPVGRPRLAPEGACTRCGHDDWRMRPKTTNVPGYKIVSRECRECIRRRKRAARARVAAA